MIIKKWFVSYRKSTNPKLRLFCFPYAGGNASFCSSWANYLPKNIEVIAIQLPGRAQRTSEPAYTDMAPLVDQIIEALKGYLDLPYAVFGHSMGAIVAYEVISKMIRLGLQQPFLFFPAGRQAPEVAEREPPIHHLTDEEFCMALLNRHYTCEMNELFKNKEMRDLILPQLRADFELCASYKYQASEAIMLGCSIIALDGADGDDCIDEEDLLAWSECTRKKFKHHRFPGGHFFIRDSEQQLMTVIKDELVSYQERLRIRERASAILA